MNDGASLNSAADKESRASGVKVRWSWVEWSEEREKERGIRGRQETPSTEWGDWYPWSPELERWRSEGSQRQTRWKERERKHPREMEHNRESPEPRVRQHDLQRTQPRREAQPDGWRRAGRRWSQMKGEKATKPGCQGTERSSVVGARAHVAESARRAVYERGGSGAQKEISQRASRGFQGPAYTEGTWRRGDGHPCARDCGSGVRKTAGKAATGAQHASRAPDDSSRNGGRPERLPSNRRVGAQGGSRPQVVPSQKSTMPSAQSVCVCVCVWHIEDGIGVGRLYRSATKAGGNLGLPTTYSKVNLYESTSWAREAPMAAGSPQRDPFMQACERPQLEIIQTQ